MAVVGRILEPKRCAIQLWDWPQCHLRSTLPLESTGPVAYSPDGASFARASATDGSLQLWEAETAKVRREGRAHTDAVWGVGFSPDSRTLATASWDGSVRLWHVRTGLELFALKDYTGIGCFSVAFSPDGKRLAAGGRSSRVVVWQTENPVPTIGRVNGSGSRSAAVEIDR